MKLRILPSIIFSMLLFYSCTNDVHQYQFSSDFEQILPGQWQIESIQLESAIEGITYKGTTFYHDTTLLDVGQVEFGTFGFIPSRWSSWDQPVTSSIAVNLKLDDENFPFIIAELDPHGLDFVGYFQPINQSIDSIDTPGEQFVWSSYVFFHNNYWLTLEGERHMRLETFSGARHVLEMEKIE